MTVSRESEYNDNGIERIYFSRSRAGFEYNEPEPMGDLVVLYKHNGQWYGDYDYGNAGSDGMPAKTALQAYFNARKSFIEANDWAGEVLQAMEEGRYSETGETVEHSDGSFEYHAKMHIEPKN